MNQLIDTGRFEEVLRSASEWLVRNVMDWHAVLQVALVLVAWAMAWLLARPLRPALESRVARLPEVLRGRLLEDVVPPQLPVLLFIGLLGVLTAVMRAITWPSHSYWMSVIVTLALAWLVIRITSGFIRNPLLSHLIAIIAWVVAALSITGLLADTIELLDSIALTIGELRISLLTVVEGTVLLAFLMWAALTVSRALERRIEAMPELAPSVRVLIGMALRITLISLALVIALASVGIDLTALAVFSGAVGIGIGFGLQKVISNLISGVILLLDRSIKPGDVIQLGNTFGWITSLGARYVSLVTRDGKEYLVPNEDLITQQVVNWSYTDELVRIETYIRAAYDCDPHQVRKVAVEAAARPKRVVDSPRPVCHIRSFGDSSLEFLLRFWIRDPKNGVENITGEVLLAVWDAFKENDIRVPYPRHEVWMREGDPRGLAPPGAPSPAGG